MKRIICLVLAFMLVLPTLPVFADEVLDAHQSISTAFEDYNVYTTTLENDGKIGIPVKIDTYVKGTTTTMTNTIIYVINHAMERIGTEDDVSIITDLLDEGYIVVVVDYQNSPKAVSPDLDWSVQGIRTKVNNGNYLNGNLYRKDYMYVLPAGCRIKRDVKFFNFLEHGAKGTEEAIIDSWNTSVKKYKSALVPPCEGNNYEGGWFEATSIDQLVRPDPTDSTKAIPIDLDLKMDFIYPSNPKEAPPLFLWASSTETRNGISVREERPMQVGLLFKGFASALYDFAYFPMARNDHYGYFNLYGMAETNGVKANTAAVRCARYYADELGYDASRIGLAGHSKGSYSALLARENPELLEETNDYTSYGYTKGENYGEQPFLTYKDGSEIPSNVQACYSSMGAGTGAYAKLLNETTCPSVIACGYHDEFGSWYGWEDIQDGYKKMDVVNIAMSMYDLGHDYPYGIDTVLNYDRYDALVDFYDYNLNGAAPQIIYTSPVDKAQGVNLDENIKIKFNAPIDEASFNKGVKIINTKTLSEVNGTWTKCNGKTEWDFDTSALDSETTYNIVITKDVKDVNGMAISEGVVTRFHTENAIGIDPYTDAYTDLENASANFGTANTLEISKDKKVAYIKFDEDAENIGKAVLNLKVTNDAKQKLVVYDAADFSEDEITSANAPSIGEKIGAITVNGKGTYKIDLTNYFETKEFPVSLAICADVETNAPAHILFDGSEAFVSGSESVNQSYSENYDIRYAGGSVSLKQSSDYDYKNDGSGSYRFYRQNAYGRVKFYNSFANYELSSEDIGREIKVSFKVYSPDVDTKLSVGAMSATGSMFSQSFHISSTINIPKNTWTTFERTYKIDEFHIGDEQAGLITLEANNTNDLYLDDIKFEVLSTDVLISSKENDLNSWMRVATNNNAVIDASNATYVESGANKTTNFDGSANLLINGSESAGSIDRISKSYIKFDISTLLDAQKVELKLNQESGTPQTVNVYGIDAGVENLNTSSTATTGSVHNWEQSKITWLNAVANDRNSSQIELNYAYNSAPIASVKTTGTGTYKVDVTSYVNALKTEGSQYVTFVITPYDTAPNDFYMNFEEDKTLVRGETSDNTEIYSDSYDLRGGGACPTPSRSSEQAYKGKYSLKQTRTQSYNRMKFHNSFKKSALTTDDIGKKYDVSMWVYSSGSATTFSFGIMAPSGSSFWKQKDISIPADTWTQASYTFEITSNMVASQAGMLTYQATGTNTLYLDEIRVTEASAPATFSSIECTTDDNKPTLVATLADESNESIVAVADSYVDSSVQTNYGSQKTLKVSNILYASELKNARKVYLKYAKGDLTDAQSAVLKFKTGDGDAQDILIYGLNNPSKVETGITYENATANDLNSNGVKLLEVYNGTPIATLSAEPNTTYEVDVFDYVTNVSGNYAAFVIVSTKNLPYKTIDWNFDDNFVNLVNNADFRKAGGFWDQVVLSEEKAYSGEKSLKIGRFAQSYNRPKFLNVFNNSILTNDDIGTTYRISFKVYPTNQGSDDTTISQIKLRAGIYSSYFGSYGSNPASSIDKVITTEKWNDISFDYKVTQNSVNGKAVTLGICQGETIPHSKYIYIDDLKIEKITSTSANAISILNDETNAPKLVVNKPIETAPIEETYSAKICDAVSSGEFKEGDTVDIGVTVKNSINVDVASVEFYNGTTLIDGKVYKDGYDYKLRIYNILPGEYNIKAVVTFTNDESVTTDVKTFSILAGKSYTVVSESVTGIIEAGKNISVTKTIRNNTSSDKNGVIVIAFYGDRDVFLGARVGESKPILVSQNASLTVAFENIPEGVSYAKVFIWNNTNDVMPIVNTQIINAQ
ncbi:MAG: hypothetical protein E7391_00165 [Ruminococcaceae bacterium]|nr:hypothetical protein [Oscillospiraceae bacterium]